MRAPWNVIWYSGQANVGITIGVWNYFRSGPTRLCSRGFRELTSSS